MNINGQTALITGGASGLGAATARYLASKGANVMVLDYDETGAGKMAQEIGGHAVGCDVSDEASVAQAIDSAVAQCGVPRIVVNCAGIATGVRIVGREGKLSTDQFRRTIEVNLIGTYHVMSYAACAMMQADPLEGSERGVIINTSSAAYEDGQLGQAAYSASKGGIASLSLPAAREFARSGIRVMAIAPGLFHTPLMDGLPDETVTKIIENIPFPDRLGQPEEFALLVASIAENAYLNGTLIRLDGAVRLPPK